jgi:hypothetical protein
MVHCRLWRVTAFADHKFFLCTNSFGGVVVSTSQATAIVSAVNYCETSTRWRDECASAFMKNDEKKQILSPSALAVRRLIRELEKAGPNPSAVLSAIKTYRSTRPKFGRLNERERVIERFTILLRDFARLQIRIAKSGVEIDRFFLERRGGSR